MGLWLLMRRLASSLFLVLTRLRSPACSFPDCRVFASHVEDGKLKRVNAAWYMYSVEAPEADATLGLDYALDERQSEGGLAGGLAISLLDLAACGQRSKLLYYLLASV